MTTGRGEGAFEGDDGGPRREAVKLGRWLARQQRPEPAAARAAGEVSSEAAKATYRELIERAYPFHPLLIDALYTRWGSHPDFQRTRCVLRLLASLVGDLWQRRQASTETQHLIQPCHIEWTMKVFRKRGRRVSLAPANPDFPTIVPQQHLRIAAVVIAVIRTYPT